MPILYRFDPTIRNRMKKRKKPSASDSSQSGVADQDLRALLERASVLPQVQAAISIACNLSDTGMDSLQPVLEHLDRTTKQITSGGVEAAETLAVSQAFTLNHLFHKLLRLGMRNIGTCHFETMLKLALRAQSQSARTLETLGALKTPLIVAKQLNVAGQQVVSNHPPQSASVPNGNEKTAAAPSLDAGGVDSVRFAAFPEKQPSHDLD